MIRGQAQEDGRSGSAPRGSGLLCGGLWLCLFASPGLASPGLASPGLASPGLASPGLAAQESAAASSADDPSGAPVAEPTSDPGVRSLQLTLQDSLRIALETNLGLDVEELATESALHDALGSWGAFDPVFSLEGSLSERESPGTSDLAGALVLEEDNQDLTTSLNVPFTTGGALDLSYRRNNNRTNNTFAAFDVSTTDVVAASLTQPLLRGAWSRFATTLQREAEVGYERQREREREVRQLLLLDVYNAYFDLVNATEELRVRELAVQLGEEQLSQDQRRLDVGAGTEVDVLQSQTNVAQQEQQLIEAQSTLRASEDALRRLLFQKPRGDVETFLEGWDVPIEPLTPLPEGDLQARYVTSLDWRGSLRRAIEGRPELGQGRLDIDAAELGLVRSKSDRMPQLDVGLSASATGFDTDPSEAFSSAIEYEFPEYRGSLTFSVPLRNRTAREAVRAARARLRSARLAYDQRELDILAEVRQAVRDVFFRWEAIEAAQKSLELAQRQLEAEQARQRIGLSTTFQVLQFQQDLNEARSAERASRSAFAKALAKLAHSEGAIEEEPPLLEGELGEGE